MFEKEIRREVRNIAVVLASGNGTRFGSQTPKQFLKLAGKTVLEHTLDVFERHGSIDEIIIVGGEANLPLITEIATDAGYKKVSKIIVGGASRRESSAAGIAAIAGADHKVLVHDAVRPLLDPATVNRCLEALDHHDAVDTAIGASDTVIRVDDRQSIQDIPDRSELRFGQTPQGFRAGLLRQAHQRAADEPDLKVTDDCGLILHYRLDQVKVVEGDTSNIKITYPSDIYLADRLFQLRSSRGEGSSLNEQNLKGKTIVIFGASRGIGQSIHSIAKAAGANVFAVSRANGVNVADETAVRETLATARKQYGPIDAVIVTAGILRTGLLTGQDYAIIDEQLTTNFRGCIVVAREAFEAMKETGGSIVLFTSSSYTRGRARSSVYSATKAAIVNLMQALSEEFRPFNVHINAVNPERTATPMRIENFGKEPPEKLLDTTTVARAALSVSVSSATGEIFDIRH